MATFAPDALPGPDYFAGARWMDAHIDELVAQFPNQWVAVYKDRVVAADPDLGKVHDAVPATVPPTDVVFQFVDDGTLVFSLSAALS